MKFIKNIVNKFKTLSKFKKIIVTLIMLPVLFWGGMFGYATSIVLIDTIFGTDISKTVNNDDYIAEQEKLKKEEQEKLKAEKEQHKKSNENKELDKKNSETENKKVEDDDKSKDKSTPKEKEVAKINKETIKDTNKEVIKKEDKNVDKEAEINNKEKHPFGRTIEKPVINGSKTERIGTYAEVMVGGKDITKENLIAFYEEVVKDSGYNWVTLNIDGKTGIQFAGASYFFTYGDIDDEGCIIKSKGDGFIIGDKIDYE